MAMMMLSVQFVLSIGLLSTSHARAGSTTVQLAGIAHWLPASLFGDEHTVQHAAQNCVSTSIRLLDVLYFQGQKGAPPSQIGGHTCMAKRDPSRFSS
mmetsp:Transcript_48961/g.85205  ORF Transcript_48961/g.85205 Transcript_48961/m.85205 type:complete len:97 (-) Transcript_48961:244-534(-)